MESINRKIPDFGSDPFMDDLQPSKKSSFDFVLWFYRIIKYWYLFVISISLFLGYAYLKNKSWIPIYRTGAILMLEARGNNSVTAGAVQLGSLVRNTINQQMLLSSYDMVVRTVDRLPNMKVDYFNKTKFKTINLYGLSPVIIDVQYIASKAYDLVFEIEPIDKDRCRIFYEGSDDTPPFSMEIRYGEFVKEPRFFITINKSERFNPNFTPFFFRFVRNEELIRRFTGRVSTGMTREGSSALSITMIGANANQDIDFLTKLLEVYEKYNLNLKNEAADQTIAFIDKQMGIIGDSLSTSELDFKLFQEQTGIYKIENVDRRQELEGLNKALGEINAQENLILVLTEDINKSILNNTELIDPSSLGLNEPGLTSSIKDYNALVSKINNIAEAHPMYAKSLQSLNKIRIKILEEVRNVQDKVQSKKEDLLDTSKAVEKEMTTMPSQEREYARYEKKYQVNDAYYNYLRQKRYEATIQKASNIPDNFIMEEPRQLGGAINAGDIQQTYLLYLVIGIAIPVCFIVCKEEVFNYSISTKDECEKLSGLPVIATIENISKKMTSGGATLVKNFPKSSFAEAFRNMRIRIEYMAQKESHISVLVTSAEPGDGKTFIAGNIASVYQLTGKKVVLVDFDLRRPAVGKLLNIQSKKGISNFLIGQVSIDDIIITHPEYEFDVIPAGTLPPNPSELIKTRKSKELIEYLQTKYDYVVVDCSPIGLVSDAYILSRYVNTSLFVVRRAKTNKAFFKSVVNQMKNDGLDHIALIFNDVKGREGYYGTSRYYGDRSYYLKGNSYYHDDYFEK